MAITLNLGNNLTYEVPSKNALNGHLRDNIKHNSSEASLKKN